MKCKCIPSQRINDIPHDVWVLIHKVTGSIISGYCTCFAGLGQSCNHIAALVLKVDDFWQKGFTQVACTELPCIWISDQRPIYPILVEDMHITKPKAERKQGVGYCLNPASKRLFSSHNANKGMTNEEFLERLALISPDSVTLGERKPVRNEVYVKYDKEMEDRTVNLPPSIESIASTCNEIEEFEAKIFDLNLNENDVNLIEENTRVQGGQVWMAQRKGRITASKFHRVNSRMNTYEKNCDIDMKPVISEVLDYNKPSSDLKALKYGRRQEQNACDTFESVLKNEGHRNVKVEKCGLFVNSSAPYLGASPDRIVSCSCCPKRVLEVKCPLKCSNTTPTPDYVECLEEVNGSIMLKRSHKYYSQIQGQMAISNFMYADFFVYAPKGYHVERIAFDQAFWQRMSSNLTIFFLNFIIPELITKSILKDMNRVKLNTERVSHFDKSSTVQPTTKVKGRKGKSKKPKLRPVYTCGVCKNKLSDVEDVEDISQCSVYCEGCQKWFHWLCVNILSENDSALEDDEYYCPTCKEANNK